MKDWTIMMRRLGLAVVALLSMTASATATYCSSAGVCPYYPTPGGPTYPTGCSCASGTYDVKGTCYARMYGGGGMAMRTTAKYAFRVQIIIANGFGTVLSDSGLNPGTFSCDFWGCSNYYDNTLFYGTCGACEARANTSYQTTATVYTGYNYSGSDTDTMSYSGWDQDTTVVATTPP